MATAALEGRRILDLGGESGAYCGKLFADMGADVVLVEPPGGDASRWLPPLWLDAPSRDRVGLSFLYCNTNKRSVTLDLADGVDRGRLLALAAAADIVLENFRPGTLDALGLGYGALRAANPRIVLTSITGFGQSGPHRDFKSSDLIANAMGGVMYVTGEADDPPVTLAGSQAYAMASTCAAASSMIALLHAQSTGQGQHVDIAMQEVVAAVCHIAGTGKWLDDGIVPRRMGSGLFASIPSGAYPCRDGLVYVMVNRPAHWQGLARWICEVTGERAVLDPIFEGPSANRLAHRDLVDHFVTELTCRYSVVEIYHEGQRRHLSFTPVHRVADVIADPHLAARGFFVEVAHADGRYLRYPGPPYRLSSTPARIRSAAPAAGADTAAVFSQWRRRAEQGTDSNADAAGALADLRVIEFTAGMAGPWIGRFMAYHGADVIKVESTARPDVTRQYVAPRRPDLGIQSQLSPWLTDWNAGKRCVALDLTHPEAVSLAIRLVAKADIVVENYATGVMEKLGLSYEVLRSVNPGLVMFSTTGFGDSGPSSRYITWGPNIEAASGLSTLTGYAHRSCTMTQYAYPDSLSALHGLFAVLAAVDYKRNTGCGQSINLSQLEATIAVMGDLFMEPLANGGELSKLGNASLRAAPHGCYRCAGDDRWVAIAVFDDSEWRALCRLMTAPQLEVDARFATMTARLANRVALDALIESWTAELDAYEVMRLLQATGVTAGVVQTAADKFERDTHLRVRGFFEAIAHERCGEVVADGIPTGLTATPGRTEFAGRAIGADNPTVFIDLLGLSREEFDRYAACGAIEIVAGD